MRLESSRPARILDAAGGEVLCAFTPCRWSLSRETCWLFDSSSGFLRLRARAEDGAEIDSPAMRTCSVQEGTKVFFEFPAAEGQACAVTIEEKGRKSRFADCSVRTPRRRPRF